jgi:hypothetical protein
MRKLKKWNGMLTCSSVGDRKNDFHRSRFHGYVAAYSQQQAANFIQSGVSEIKTYWGKCWGVDAEKNIPEPTEPCFWVFDKKENEWVDVTPRD